MTPWKSRNRPKSRYHRPRSHEYTLRPLSGTMLNTCFRPNTDIQTNLLIRIKLLCSLAYGVFADGHLIFNCIDIGVACRLMAPAGIDPRCALSVVMGSVAGVNCFLQEFEKKVSP